MIRLGFEETGGGADVGTAVNTTPDCSCGGTYIREIGACKLVGSGAGTKTNCWRYAWS